MYAEYYCKYFDWLNSIFDGCVAVDRLYRRPYYFF